MNKPLSRLREIYLAGILVTVPLVATALAVWFLFERTDSLLGPLIARFAGREIPGLGVAATILMVGFMGLVARNVIGHRILRAGEFLLSRLPLVKAVYKTAKDIVGALANSRSPTLRETVMIEYPRPGVYAYGFLTSYTTRIHAQGDIALANVYLPSPPVPTSGVLVAVPVEQVVFLEMTGEETMKLIVSGGLASPAQLRSRAS